VLTWQPDDSTDAGDVDHCATGVLKVPGGLPGAQEGPAKVHVEGLVERVAVDALRGPECSIGIDSRVVHDDVRPAEFLVGPFDEAPYPVVVCDVGRHCDRVRTPFFDRTHGTLDVCPCP
jgi:hypothetical protein